MTHRPTSKARAARIVDRNAPEHPYKKYESHPYWKRVDKAISNLVRNHDLVERAAREYIVGYLCKMILKPNKRSRGGKTA